MLLGLWFGRGQAQPRLSYLIQVARSSPGRFYGWMELTWQTGVIPNYTAVVKPCF